MVKIGVNFTDVSAQLKQAYHFFGTLCILTLHVVYGLIFMSCTILTVRWMIRAVFNSESEPCVCNR